jgi:aminoglycoside phosphotransferase (APT) family kinase protein
MHRSLKENPVTTAVASQQSHEDVLRSSLQRIVAEQFGAPADSISQIDRNRSQFSSFYASDIVTVGLSGGRTLKVFLKDFGSFDHAKDTMKQRREREVVVYRDLLAGAGLDTAQYYGSVWDEAQGRFWLLLEYVEGVPVSHLEFEDWVAAATWLGRMYGYFAAHPELWSECDALVQHDAAFFQSIAQQALRSVCEFSADLGRRLEPFVRRYDRAVAVMTNQPRTLVHGTYRPAQIIIDRARQPARICPVDFEKAAIGASLYDLTFIADGFDQLRLYRLFDAYRVEAERCGVHVLDNEQMRSVVNCFRLHRIMNWLAVSMARRYEEEVIRKLVGMAEEVGGLALGA